MNLFKSIIKNSDITSSDWVYGGRFSGLVTEAGIRHLVRLIFNNYEETVCTK